MNGMATGVDLGSKNVTVGDNKLSYSKLIIATGARPLRASKFGVKGDG